MRTALMWTINDFWLMKWFLVRVRMKNQHVHTAWKLTNEGKEFFFLLPLAFLANRSHVLSIIIIIIIIITITVIIVVVVVLLFIIYTINLSVVRS